MVRAAGFRDLLRAGQRHVRLCALLLLLSLPGCASVYFRAAGMPPAEGLRYSLDQLPFTEYWTGIVFNGDKIGYSHFKLRPLHAARHEITSEASFVLRFLGIEKKVHLRARDVVTDGLELVEFDYDYRIDGSELLVTGKHADATLEVTTVRGGQPLRETLAVREKLYPASVIALYPVVFGLNLHRDYQYLVYDGQLQKLAPVEQRVEGYEKSEFFPGSAFKLTTSLHGQRTSTWIDASGRPAFELAMNGVMIAALEDEASAKQYVVRAALNQRETLLEFSLVKPEVALAAPRQATYMRVALQGLDRTPLNTRLQSCQRIAGGEQCEIRSPSGAAGPALDQNVTPAARYLEPSATVQSAYPNIRITAREIAGAERDRSAQIQRLLQWMGEHIEKAPLDVFSAVDVLEKRKAECQGHAYLFTAFARSLGIPTRIVNGLVYSEMHAGFLFHTWVESWIDGAWWPIDPIFGQRAADATHIMLLEGEALGDLLPLLDWVGKLKIRVLAIEYRNS